jgi:hypothetical protein
MCGKVDEFGFKFSLKGIYSYKENMDVDLHAGNQGGIRRDFRPGNRTLTGEVVINSGSKFDRSASPFGRTRPGNGTNRIQNFASFIDNAVKSTEEKIAHHLINMRKQNMRVTRQERTFDNKTGVVKTRWITRQPANYDALEFPTDTQSGYKDLDYTSPINVPSYKMENSRNSTTNVFAGFEKNSIINPEDVYQKQKDLRQNFIKRIRQILNEMNESQLETAIGFLKGKVKYLFGSDKAGDYPMMLDD